MGIKGIDHDTLANRRDRWIGRSRVVSVPSNAEVDAVWFILFRARDRMEAYMTPMLGVFHDE